MFLLSKTEEPITSTSPHELDNYGGDRLTKPEVPYEVENIVISGGGTKGYSFVGSLKVVLKYNNSYIYIYYSCI